MTPVDRAILERLLNEGNIELVLTPAVIGENIDYKAQTVREHLIELRKHGMVEYHDKDRAMYRLTDRGRGWTQGEIPTEEVDDDGE